jgi:hypothetical protein
MIDRLIYKEYKNRTPSNVLAMDFLGVVGNSSNLPYQTNTVNYYIGNEAIIYNGRGVINETNDFYNLTYMMVILIYIKQSKIQH